MKTLFFLLKSIIFIITKIGFYTVLTQSINSRLLLFLYDNLFDDLSDENGCNMDHT